MSHYGKGRKEHSPVNSVMDATTEREAGAELKAEHYQLARASTDDENERLIRAEYL